MCVFVFVFVASAAAAAEKSDLTQVTAGVKCLGQVLHINPGQLRGRAQRRGGGGGAKGKGDTSLN